MAKVLKGKRILVFEEMVEAFLNPDGSLARDILKGFDLMGKIDSNPDFPPKTTFATVTPDQVGDSSLLG